MKSLGLRKRNFYQPDVVWDISSCKGKRVLKLKMGNLGSDLYIWNQISYAGKFSPSIYHIVFYTVLKISIFFSYISSSSVRKCGSSIRTFFAGPEPTYAMYMHWCGHLLPKTWPRWRQQGNAMKMDRYSSMWYIPSWLLRICSMSLLHEKKSLVRNAQATLSYTSMLYNHGTAHFGVKNACSCSCSFWLLSCKDCYTAFMRWADRRIKRIPAPMNSFTLYKFSPNEGLIR